MCVSPFLGLKGRNISARGEAPGKEFKKLALKVRHKLITIAKLMKTKWRLTD